MSKEQYTKLTLQELIAKKEQKLAAKQKPKQAELYVASLDGTVTVQAPDLSTMQDSVKMEERGDIYLVYQCCIEPRLKASELRDAYGCAEPIDIVELVFEPGEIQNISKKLLSMAGYDDDSVKLVETAKN